MQTLKAEMATKSISQSLRADVVPDLAQVRSDMARMQKDNRDQIVGRRRAVIGIISPPRGTGSSSASSKNVFAGRDSISNCRRWSHTEALLVAALLDGPFVGCASIPAHQCVEALQELGPNSPIFRRPTASA